MWAHTVIEIYSHVICDGETLVTSWPDKGDPADWIEKGLVGYCQGDAHSMVALTPLWKLLWWKLTDWADRFREWADWHCQGVAARVWGVEENYG